MLKIVRVPLHERVVLFKNGLPLRALGPGRHWIWGFRITVLRMATPEVIFHALPEIRAVLPPEQWKEVTLGTRERGILYRDGRPMMFLRPGVHRFWVVDPSIELRIHSVDGPVPELTDELAKVIPRAELVDVTVPAHARGLEYVQGKLARVLEPGRYVRWSYPEAQVSIFVLDVRRQQVAIAGQELMTRDKVTLRLSLTIEYGIEDPAKAVTDVADVRDAVYLIVQLAARDYVASVSLDQLLEGRDAMTQFLEQDAVPKAARFGVRIERVGVKDVVLPGEMKTLLNRVIEAEKEAAANVILRREETAATRSLANTARVMADQPVLLRLKELETLKQIAESIDEVRLVVGSDGLDKLMGAQLLGGAKTPLKES